MFSSPQGELVSKSVFIIFAQGEMTRQKVRKICEAFGANLYPCPDTAGARRDMATQVSARLDDLSTVLLRTREHREKQLREIAEKHDVWLQTAKQEKAIFTIMNKFNFDVTSKALIAEGWIPTSALGDVQNALTVARERSQSAVPIIMHAIPTRDTPPTYNRVNRFTTAFQTIIDAYGVGHYREINPTPFSIITFPFLFAVMFGDLGHGFLVTIVAALMVWFEKAISKRKLDEVSGCARKGGGERGGRGERGRASRRRAGTLCAHYTSWHACAPLSSPQTLTAE